MKTIVITGVTSGFGRSWLYQLDAAGPAKLFVLARNEVKLASMLAKQALRNELHVIPCDLASLQSVANAADEIRRQTEVVDVLINNAGVWSEDAFTPSADGIELTLAVNHLAPYLLTGKLLDRLTDATQGRVVNTASFRHADANVDTNDIELKNGYSAERAYCNSKLYSILFTKQLAAATAQSALTVNCFDPGIVDTPMLKQAFPKPLTFIYPWFRKHFARAPSKGAETGVYLSLSPACQTISGEYFKDCAVKPLRGFNKNGSP
ncbi:SDR family NAD(P)-dependent oxidoreductase [Alkalilimnicola ehrlichii]|uniref:Short-chain dehydrogenase n=1 Tax=Alkalilimnicola ehrlichii TaxID=351052 RepID=A0A3E0WY47_9GAMM|nr:SDR family NAD(P)-dependent oxidoreductase [Alkalilimnicola ehrlichii]RFA36827.1 hypothetical protein CAL65_09905 [Alkalilimnicola ehrlichii]